MRYIWFVLLVLLLAVPAQALDGFTLGATIGENPDEKRFEQIKEIGMGLVITEPALSPDQNKQALDWADRHGLKMVVSDERLQVSVESAPSQDQVKAVIADYSEHDALLGYHVWPSNPGVMKNTAAINLYLVQNDPDHLVYVPAEPSMPNNAIPYWQYLSGFIYSVKPRLLIVDSSASYYQEFKPETVYAPLDYMRRYGTRYDIVTIAEIAAPPSNAEVDFKQHIMWLTNLALAHGVKGIVYKNVFPHSEDDGKSRLEDLKKIAAEVKALGPVMMKLKSVGLFHTGNVPAGATPILANSIIESVDGSPLIEGQFLDEKGQKYIMFVNKSPKESAKVRIHFSEKVMLYEISRASGSERLIRIGERMGKSMWKTSFDPGEAVLVKLVPKSAMPDSGSILPMEEQSFGQAKPYEGF